MNKKILFVDDDQNLLSAFHRSFRNHFEVTTLPSAAEGISLLQNAGNFALIVSDYRMPKIDGVQFLTMAKKIAPDTIRIMLTGQADLQAAMNAVNEGSLFRFLIKPCDPHELMKAINDGLEQFRLVTGERELLDKTLRGSIKVLADILAIVNPEAFSHSSRVLDLAKKIGLRLGIKNEWEMELAVMLSQIGCVTLPGSILAAKYQNQTLTPAENEMFHDHPLFGRRLLENIPRLESVAEAIAYQNKNYDGSGFPKDSRKGDDIPLLSRVLKVVLDFDLEMISGKTESAALRDLQQQMNCYDPVALKALEAEFSGLLLEKRIREITIDEIQSGMIVAEDISSASGVILVPKGQEITEVLKKRLQNFAQLNYIIQPVKVLKPLVG